MSDENETIERVLDTPQKRVSEFLRLWKTGHHNGDTIHAYNMVELLVSDIEQLISDASPKPGDRLPGGLQVVRVAQVDAIIRMAGIAAAGEGE